MNPGLLAHDRIDFEKPVKITTATTMKDGWKVAYANVPVQVVHGAGMKYGHRIIDADEIAVDYTVRFTVRYHYRNLIDTDMVIVYNKKRFRILDINPQFAQKNVVITGEPIMGGNMS